MLNQTTKQTFFHLLDRRLEVKDFERWVYNSSNRLEGELQADFYINLISFNYNQKDTLQKLRDIINPFIDIQEFNTWRTKELLNDIINDKIDLVVASRKLRDLYFETGEDFIPITLGIGYESELDDVPVPSEYSLWNKKDLDEKLKKVEWYKDRILQDSREFLNILKKKIKTGHNRVDGR